MPVFSPICWKHNFQQIGKKNGHGSFQQIGKKNGHGRCWDFLINFFNLSLQDSSAKLHYILYIHFTAQVFKLLILFISIVSYLLGWSCFQKEISKMLM